MSKVTLYLTLQLHQTLLTFLRIYIRLRKENDHLKSSRLFKSVLKLHWNEQHVTEGRILKFS